MIHPKTELKFISPEVGYGVVATERIPAGTITWVLDRLDREFRPRDIQDLDPVYRDILETYTFRNNKGNFVLCWDNARFVNHSFRSNCLTTAYDCEIAIRDIEVGEELTDDYGYLNITRPFRGKNEGTRRKTVYPDDLKKYFTQWDKQLAAVYPLMFKVDQPLRAIMLPQVIEKLQRIAAGELMAESILLNYFEDLSSAEPEEA